MSPTTIVREEQQISRGNHCQHHPFPGAAQTGKRLWQEMVFRGLGALQGPGGSSCLLLQAPHSQEQQECFTLHLKYTSAKTAQQLLFPASASPQSLVFCSLIASQQHSCTTHSQPSSQSQAPGLTLADPYSSATAQSATQTPSILLPKHCTGHRQEGLDPVWGYRRCLNQHNQAGHSLVTKTEL